jgi:uncharacterized protein
MRCRQIRPFRSFLLVLVLLSLTAAMLRAAAPTRPAAETKRFFWKATSPTAEVYLLGSVHVASRDMYPLPAEIEAAYTASANLVVEADVTNADLAQSLALAAKGMYPQGDSLDKHIAPETLAALRTFCAANGLPLQLISAMKPAMAAAMVEETLLEKAGYSATDGIDLHFLNAAHAAKDKKIVELESADAQMNLLFSFDDKLAEKWLKETIKEDTKEELAKMMKSWNEGDPKVVEEDMTRDEKTDPDARKMNEALIYQRNDGMVKKIDDLLKGNEKSFVVVGAAHILGEKGIVKQLQAKGYKVEQPKLTAPPAASRPATTAR